MILHEEVKSRRYVRVIQDLHENSERLVKCVVGVTEGFKVGVGLLSAPSFLQ